MNGRDTHNLERFLAAQAEDFQRALRELQRGRKESHWIWYIFPQVAELGHSSTAQEYAIRSKEEAVAYLNHAVLGPRLQQCCEALLKHQDRKVQDIMGPPDDLKLRSSMTLFAMASTQDSVFHKVLGTFYSGQMDDRTIAFLDAIKSDSANLLQLGGGSGLELVQIPAGEFVMGSPNGFPLEQPVHPVRLRHAFFIGRFPVTQGQWLAIMGNNPSFFSGAEDLPAEQVSWDDAIEFTRELAARTGRAVRLPSEAEWEYACRAGVSEEFFFGSSDAALKEYAWFDLNSNGHTHSVGMKRPNPWGLHDLLGNVWEWCQDVWHNDYAGAPADGSAWLDGAQGQPRRCLRGGAWNYDAFRCRSAYRSREWRNFPADHFGFRVVVGSA